MRMIGMTGLWAAALAMVCCVATARADVASGDSTDFSMDLTSQISPPGSGDSGDFATDLVGVNRGWADSPEFTIDTQPPPVPELVSISVPTQATPGTPFDVTVTLRNNGDPGDHGGISISFPDLNSVDSSMPPYNSAKADVATHAGTTFATVNYFDAGDPIDMGGGGETDPALHLLVEGDEASWSAGEEQTLKLTVTPKEPGPLKIRVRGWIALEGTEYGPPVYRDPSADGAGRERDQQTYWSEVVTVDVEEPTQPLEMAITPNGNYGDLIRTVGDKVPFYLTFTSGGEPLANTTVSLDIDDELNGFTGSVDLTTDAQGRAVYGTIAESAGQHQITFGPASAPGYQDSGAMAFGVDVKDWRVFGYEKFWTPFTEGNTNAYPYCTHLLVAGADMYRSESGLDSSGGWDRVWDDYLGTNHLPSVSSVRADFNGSILLVIGTADPGVEPDVHFHDVCTEWSSDSPPNPTGKTQQFCEALVGFVKEHGYDGIDVDFESLEVEDKTNYKYFIEYLRRELPDRLITLAVQGERLDFYSLSDIADDIDYCTLMAYDFFLSSEDPTAAVGKPNGPWEVFPEDSPGYNAKAQLESLVNDHGYPSGKIILAMPFYSYGPHTSSEVKGWKDLTVDQRSALRSSNGEDPTYSRYLEEPLVFPEEGDAVMYFNTPKALLDKTARARIMGLAGVGTWYLGLDTSDGELTQVLWNSMGEYLHISGSVTKGGSPVSEVFLSTTNGGGTAKTGDGGQYWLLVPTSWSGTVTPSRDHYSFDPSQRSYTNVTADQDGQDYTAQCGSGAGPFLPMMLGALGLFVVVRRRR